MLPKNKVYFTYTYTIPHVHFFDTWSIRWWIETLILCVCVCDGALTEFQTDSSASEFDVHKVPSNLDWQSWIMSIEGIQVWQCILWISQTYLMLSSGGPQPLKDHVGLIHVRVLENMPHIRQIHQSRWCWLLHLRMNAWQVKCKPQLDGMDVNSF